MTWEWKIGDPVDDANGGTMDAMNWGHGSDKIRIIYYGEALEYGEEYFEESKRRGISVEGMLDRNHLLSKADVDWISKKHYDEFYKIHVLSTDQTENLENLLKKSGNGRRIR